MERLGPVVGTVLQAGLAEALDSARGARERGADRVELRVDPLIPEAALLAVRILAPEMPLLVSGSRDRVLPGEISVLREAQERGAWVDLPWGEGYPEDLWGLDRSRLVLSHHDFEKTPENLPGILDLLRGAKAALYKIVPSARDFEDLLSVRALLERGGGDLCAFPMGGPGVAGRVMALAWGSAATYAAAPGSGPAAPGQMTLEELLDMYRPREASAFDPLFAVVGWPLNRTGSPALHNPWLRKSGLPGRFVPLPVRDLDSFFENAEALPLQGLAVTVPHKERVLARAAGISRLARRIGAANTLRRFPGAWHAANTDVFGVRRALAEVPGGARTLLLGTGGAASAAAEVLRRRGPLAVASRDAARAEAFALRYRARSVPWRERSEFAWDLLVNATPVGQTGEELPVEAGSLRGGWIFDMVVRPEGTPLIMAGRRRGLGTIPGEAMLEAQARLQFRLFTGRKPPS